MSDTREARLGSFEVSVKEERTVDVPASAGVGAIAVGGSLLVPWNKGRMA